MAVSTGFELVIILGVFSAAVHIYGFIRKRQPMFENLEIVVFMFVSVWLGISILTRPLSRQLTRRALRLPETPKPAGACGGATRPT